MDKWPIPLRSNSTKSLDHRLNLRSSPTETKRVNRNRHVRIGSTVQQASWSRFEGLGTRTKFNGGRGRATPTGSRIHDVFALHSQPCLWPTTRYPAISPTSRATSLETPRISSSMRASVSNFAFRLCVSRQRRALWPSANCKSEFRLDPLSSCVLDAGGYSFHWHGAGWLIRNCPTEGNSNVESLAFNFATYCCGIFLIV